MKTRLLPLLAAVAIVATLGVIHGIATDRWGPSGQLERALATLPRVPMSFGDWEGEDLAYEPEDMARAGIRGTVYRRYHNKRTRETVSLLLVCGRGGPISVHTPDICYGGAGYRQYGDTEWKPIQGGHEFRIDRFAMPNDLSQSRLEVFLAWSQDGRTWEAPKNARYSLARARALYKLYVVREHLPNEPKEDVGTTEQFLQTALPVLIEILPPASE